MAIGGGIIPATGSQQYNELTYTTRRAFIPKLVVQLYNSSPAIAALFANAQTASGGVSSVTVPVQGAAMTTTQWTDYSGSFAQPTDQQGIYNAEHNLKFLVTPVPMLGTEGLVQQDAAIIPIIEARMNDATNVMLDALSTALFNNSTNTQALIGLPAAISASGTYGGIVRSSNTWWQSASYTANANPTRQLLLQYIVGVNKKGAEMPSFGLCGPGTWALLAQDYVGQEQYVITPGSGFAGSDADGPQAAFKALSVAGVPIYFDPYCPEGTMYFINTNYLGLYVHEMASFAFTGFESTLPNWQIGYVGAVMLIAELVNTKPKAMGVVTGLNYVNV